METRQGASEPSSRLAVQFWVVASIGAMVLVALLIGGQRKNSLSFTPVGVPGYDFQDIAYSPDGKWLAATFVATAQTRAGVLVWDAHDPGASPTELPLYPSEATAHEVFFSADSKTLATFSYGKGFSSAWDMGKVPPARLIPPGSLLNQLSDPKPPSFLNLALLGFNRLPSCNGCVDPATLSPDGKTLATVDGFGDTIQLWDELAVAQYAKLQSTKTPVPLSLSNSTADGKETHGAVLCAFAHTVFNFSPDGAYFLATSTGGFPRGASPESIAAVDAGMHGVFVWNVRRPTAPPLWFDAGKDSDCPEAAMSPDGHTLAVEAMNWAFGTDAVNQPSVLLYDVSRPASTPVRLYADTRIDALAFSPDGEVLATIARHGSLRLWKIR